MSYRVTPRYEPRKLQKRAESDESLTKYERETSMLYDLASEERGGEGEQEDTGEGERVIGGDFQGHPQISGIDYHLGVTQTHTFLLVVVPMIAAENVPDLHPRAHLITADAVHLRHYGLARVP